MAGRRRPAHGGMRTTGTTEIRRIAQLLSELSREFYRRGWALGTSGNFSAVTRREPLRLAITHSGVDKGSVTPEQIVVVDSTGKPCRDAVRPSEEVLLHLAIANSRGAGAILHTHSIWSTITSETHAREGGILIHGYEMLKGLDGVHSHEHREWLPIIENSQRMEALARALERTLDQHPESHGILLRRHGLYTWGKDLAVAKRHVEILEFLLEVTGRQDGD